MLAASALVSAHDSASFNQVWSKAEFLGDRKASQYPVMKLRGRYQGQYFNIDADDDGKADDFETRRLRLGLDTYFTSDIRLSFDLNLNSDGKEPFVDDFDYLSLDWKIGKSTKLSLGKLRRKPLTIEDSTSSNKILTVERSLVANSVTPDNLGGIYLSHKHGDWSLGGGVMSGGLDDDLELPDGDGGIGVQVNVGRPLNKSIKWRVDYLFNDGDDENEVFADYRHVVSLNSDSKWGSFKLQTDLVLAESLASGPGDLLGLVLLPSIAITPQLHGVLRYTYLQSSEDDGVRLGSRYERRADNLTKASERGKRYNALYAGANYLIYGDKLKFMLGLEYSSMSREAQATYTALTALGAFRIYF